MPAAGRLAALGAAALALGPTGCGGGGDPPPPTAVTALSAPPAATPAPAAATRVIRRWSDTLRHGDVQGAAELFALPSIVQIQPGSPPERITRRREAIAFNLVLPCGAQLLRAERDGRYVNALFRLTSRPGARCDAPGATARTAFVIRHGKIAEWRRAPDQPGDDEAERSSAPDI